MHKVSHDTDYVRSIVSPDRLSSLTVLSFQCQVARKLHSSYIIDYFARMELQQRAPFLEVRTVKKRGEGCSCILPDP